MQLSEIFFHKVFKGRVLGLTEEIYLDSFRPLGYYQGSYKTDVRDKISQLLKNNEQFKEDFSGL